MLCLLLLFLIAVPAADAATADQRYVRANARLAHATPAYPHARLLVQRGTACLVSGAKLVLVLVEPNRRRLGVLVDSRGARRCSGLRGILGDFLGV
jgi:hypothetical protein